MLTIVEIITEAQQGMTRPFLCRADDGHAYFVKRVGTAGRAALVAEWVAGHLAAHLGLPIPHFDIAIVPEALLSLRSRDERREWGRGPHFASRVVENVSELNIANIPQIPNDQRAMILLFDAWIGNGDRILGIQGGNPNMLWDSHRQILHVIDHNLAFMTDSPVDVMRDHAFADSAALFNDIRFMSTWPPRLRAAASTLDDIWRTLPDEWIAEEGCQLLSLEQIRTRLQTCADLNASAWTLLP